MERTKSGRRRSVSIVAAVLGVALFDAAVVMAAPSNFSAGTAVQPVRLVREARATEAADASAARPAPPRPRRTRTSRSTSAHHRHARTDVSARKRAIKSRRRSQSVPPRRTDGRWIAVRTVSMEASAYWPDPAWSNGYTATGLKAQRGIVAVDPSVIPLGTHLYVPGYGQALAADTGGAIVGDRLDLCFDTAGEAIGWGVRDVKVIVEASP